MSHFKIKSAVPTLIEKDGQTGVFYIVLPHQLSSAVSMLTALSRVNIISTYRAEMKEIPFILSYSGYERSITKRRHTLYRSRCVN